MTSNTTAEDSVLGDGSQSSSWVRFEEDEGIKHTSQNQELSAKQAQPIASAILNADEYSGAVINPETVHVNVNQNVSRSVSPEKPDVSVNKATLASCSSPQQYSGAVINTESVHLNLDRSSLSRAVGEDQQPPETTPTAAHKLQDARIGMRNVDLRETNNGRPAANTRVLTLGNSVIRQGFANGDIVVTLLPVNTRWPWITPAQFRPELVPEELMAQGLTLTVEDYVHVMEILTNDVRFNVYNVCYKRILVAWIFTAFIVLLGLLFSGVTGLTLFGLGVMWLVLNAAAIFLCMWIKIKLNRSLERCMAQVNKHLLRHKIILGLDDRGKLSCHKVNLCFIYFDTMDCIKKLQEVIEREEREGRTINREETSEERRQRQQFQQRMDIEDRDIIIQGSNTTRLSRKQERAELVFLRYSQRWAKEYVRRHLELSVDGAERGGFSMAPPRHCISARCPCQFVEEHLKYKPREVT
ncbi:transmembrane protein 268 isoform X3 [Zootermopsis nevadensis]|uniref:transmembrane protein 268 isoform X3 n=1 Tax=Zootermopsis nevadensis TaxID=136037 RepID=UPI000B8E2F29|nr:transmembrane protein 268 isoform X3 [Zootermopsis nevadensis]